MVFVLIGLDDNCFLMGILIGCYVFCYKVIDDCNNFIIIDVLFCIEDNIVFLVVCDDDLNILLGGNGVVWVFVMDIDEGSSDNCEIVIFEVWCLYEFDFNDCSDVMDYYFDWGNFVDFFCCDVGSMVIIEFCVIDIYGNQNICWLEVMIEDKINLFCVVLVSIMISCVDILVGFELESFQVLEALFGVVIVMDDCGVVIVNEFILEFMFDVCGFGIIMCMFIVFDNVGNQFINICQQVIMVMEEYNYMIKFLKDEIFNCGVFLLDMILVNGQGCDMFLVSVFDEYFYLNVGGNDVLCYKIFCCYWVQNMCEWDGIFGLFVVGCNEDCDVMFGDEDVWVVCILGIMYIDCDNNLGNSNFVFGVKGMFCDGQINFVGYWCMVLLVGYWQYIQIIEVKDEEVLEISFVGFQEFCSINQVICNVMVQFLFMIVENCDFDNFDIIVQLDVGVNGMIDFNVIN